MKMVAAARLRRAEDRVRSARPYIDRLQQFLDGIAHDPEALPHPLAEVRIPKKFGLLIMTSDRGLCGAFNTNLFKEVDKFIKERGAENVSLYIVGRKGNDHYKRAKVNIAATFLNLDQTIQHREVKNIFDTVSKDFIESKIDELYLAFASYKSPAVCRPLTMKILPVTSQEKEEGAAHIGDVIFQPSPEAILEQLFPKYIFSRILVSLAETFASEQGQRMVSMTTATDNAAEMAKALTLTYNKVRQSAITKEISEIVGGAEAIKG